MLYYLQHPSFHSAQHPLLPSQWTVRPLTHTVNSRPLNFNVCCQRPSRDQLSTTSSKISHEHIFPRILRFAYEYSKFLFIFEDSLDQLQSHAP